jgi:hypothetical protein
MTVRDYHLKQLPSLGRFDVSLSPLATVVDSGDSVPSARGVANAIASGRTHLPAKISSTKSGQ